MTMTSALTSTATVSTMDIHVFTQYYENYGDEQKPYWKAKGGSTIVLTGFTHPLSDGIGAAAQAAVDSVRDRIEYRNPLAEQFIIDWDFAAVGSLTEDEQDQQKYDGRVYSPSTRIAL